MEVAVLILGVVLRILDLLLAPLFWLRARDRRAVPPPKTPLLLRSAAQHAAAIRNGEITSEELVSAYIERVKEVNPLLNAVVDERYRAALEDAKEVDRGLREARKNGTLASLVENKPLLGVPFTVKESCSLAGLSNAVGCLEFAGRKATKDGGAVRLVKEAGGIPVLVSNTPELCLGWETTNLLNGTTNNPYCLERTAGGSSGGECIPVLVSNTPELCLGWETTNLLNGTTNNPYCLERTAGGVSGGEAALLAAAASAVSVSSDIAGSIRVPAAFCGVFGHKPTPGIVPVDGHVPTIEDPRFPWFLGVGPMTRYADDLPLMLGIMAGDNREKLRLDRPVDFKQLKVYYMTEAAMSPALMDVHPLIKDKIRCAVEYLRTECGATICEDKFTDLEDSVEISVTEFFAMKDIPNLLQDPANPKRDKSVALELLKHCVGGGTRSLQALGFSLLSKSQLLVSSARAPHYRAKAARLRRHMQSTLGENGVFLYPVFGASAGAHYHGQVLGRASGVIYATPANVLGLPAATTPCGVHGGLPAAIQIIAAPEQDRLCLAVAKQLESAFGGWRPAGL